MECGLEVFIDIYYNGLSKQWINPACLGFLWCCCFFQWAWEWLKSSSPFTSFAALDGLEGSLIPRGWRSLRWKCVHAIVRRMELRVLDFCWGFIANGVGGSPEAVAPPSPGTFVSWLIRGKGGNVWTEDVALLELNSFPSCPLRLILSAVV